MSLYHPPHPPHPHPHIGRIIPTMLFTPLLNPGNARIEFGALGCCGIDVSQVTLVALPLLPNGLICVECVHSVENEGCIIIITIIY